MSQPSPRAPASNRAPASAPTGSKTNIASTVAAGKRAAGSTVGSAASGTDVATVSNTYIDIWRETPYTRYVRVLHYVSLLVIVLPQNLGARPEFILCVLVLSAFLKLNPIERLDINLPRIGRQSLKTSNVIHLLTIRICAAMSCSIIS